VKEFQGFAVEEDGDHLLGVDRVFLREEQTMIP
jgi:hypothetical protein